MAHKILDTPPKVKSEESLVKRVFHITAPNLVGKFGLSFSWGKREIFVGIAFAEIEIEKVIKRKKQKPILYQEGRGRVVDL